MIIFIILTLFYLINSQQLTTFPNHDPKDDVMINPQFDSRDHPACGLFKQPPTTTGRVFNGEQPYIGQFPWTVCFLRPVGPHLVKDFVRKSWLRHPDCPVEDIFEQGPYEFSRRKAEVAIEKVTSWTEFCTGSIIDEHWIITAAHCTQNTWEGMYFYVNAGTTQCLEVVDEEMIKLVVATRNDAKLKTIFEHPNYLARKGEDIRYDFALIRINDGFRLPVDTYNNEAINRICIYSSNDLPKESCLRNVYFSGFGMKSDTVPNVNDLKYNLTWLTFTRMSFPFCKIHGSMRDIQRDEMNCFSSVPEHGYLKFNPSKLDAAIRNKTAAENYPNTCPGDSGGPFTYYMKYTDTNTSGLQPGYRALLINVLQGGGWRKGGAEHQYICEKNYYSGKDQVFGKFYNPFRTVFYRTVDRAPIVSTKLNSSWFNDALSYSHEGHSSVKGSFKVFPQVYGQV